MLTNLLKAQQYCKESWLVFLRNKMAREIAEFSNVIADNQNDLVHILENASHFNDADSGYRHVRVRDIQKNTDVSACNVKGKVLQSIVPRQIHVEDNGYRDTNPVN